MARGVAGNFRGCMISRGSEGGLYLRPRSQLQPGKFTPDATAGFRARIIEKQHVKFRR
jgi:hypothetical protein